MSRALQAAGTVILLTALLWVSARGLGPVPPLGPLLDPVHGVWSVAAQAELPASEIVTLPGLDRPVEVLYDRRAVPHIFAADELDAVRALGWVVARDRLFQLEVQWRAGAGRLTEMIGGRALRLDRAMRGLGLPRAAEQAWARLDPEGRARLEAFAQGVNGWIETAGRRAIPLEYHLLGIRPALWEPINSLHLQNRMGYTLAYSRLERQWSEAAKLVGPKAADALFPIQSPIQEPIVPSGRSRPRFYSGRLPPPDLRGRLARADVPTDPFAVALNGTEAGLPPMGHTPEASNNWAVAPSRSASGHALLAGDPHLDLTLPSIWYEAHLVVADSLDTYGVTIPGWPSIVIGFNRDVAWTFTNTESDVLDRYREEVDDSAHPTRYRLDGEWRPLELRTASYRGPHGVLIGQDTLRFSHRGPLQAASGGWESLRWTVLEAPGLVTGLARAMRSRSAEGYLNALAGNVAPAQNMLVADRAGTIEIRSTGYFPIRPGGRGDTLMDGRHSSSDWTGFWRLADYPQARSPDQGYLASANQQPIDPAVNPTYLGAAWPSPWRALRINQLLRADSAVTPDAMRRFQTDPGSVAADLMMPALLEVGGASADDTVRRAGQLLAEWDRRFTADNQRAVLFESVRQAMRRLTWDELRAGPTPGDMILVELLRDPDNDWWDLRATPDRRERRDDIIAMALGQGYLQTVRDHGPPDAGGWRWSVVEPAAIYHLLRIPALSALGLGIQGGPGTLNPSTGGYGASWRMVVELGPTVRGWGTYPGGQSGNPASARYLDRLSLWQEGRLDTLAFPKSREELSGKITSHLLLEPAQ